MSLVCIEMTRKRLAQASAANVVIISLYIMRQSMNRHCIMARNAMHKVSQNLGRMGRK